jgi:hypothetical protein
MGSLCLFIAAVFLVSISGVNDSSSFYLSFHSSFFASVRVAHIVAISFMESFVPPSGTSARLALPKMM